MFHLSPLSPHFKTIFFFIKKLGENEIIGVNQEEKEVFFNVFFFGVFSYCKMNVHFNTRIFFWFFCCYCLLEDEHTTT
jgi:hypothetical protein